MANASGNQVKIAKALGLPLNLDYKIISGGGPHNPTSVQMSKLGNGVGPFALQVVMP
jgi:hypothetical protein